MQPTEIVTEQAKLEAHCAQWRELGVFAFDTEFIRDETYDAALCLIQVAADGQVVLIDPMADVDVTPFWELVSDQNVTSVVHAGKEDFEVCYRMTGQLPRNVFDVQIAAGFVGLGYPLSLLRLVESLIHKRIAKGQTLTDWLRRPLTDAQLRYAAEDVLYLPEIYKRLSKQVARMKRQAWLAEELQVFEDAEYYRMPDEERVQRLKGSRRLDGLGLLVLERLVAWRDEWAQSRNRPPRAMMRDDVMVEVARRRPKREQDLQVLRGFPQSKNRKVVGEILDIIAEAAKVPKSKWPQPRVRREDTPMAKVMLDLLSAVTQAICLEEQLSRNLLGGAQRLRDLLDFHGGRAEQRPELLRGWREQFIGRRLLEMLEGRTELHISGWPDHLQLELVNPTTRAAGADR